MPLASVVVVAITAPVSGSMSWIVTPAMRPVSVGWIRPSRLVSMNTVPLTLAVTATLTSPKRYSTPLWFAATGIAPTTVPNPGAPVAGRVPPSESAVPGGGLGPLLKPAGWVWVTV